MLSGRIDFKWKNRKREPLWSSLRILIRSLCFAIIVVPIGVDCSLLRMFDSWALDMFVAYRVFDILDETLDVLLLATWTDHQHIVGVDHDIVL